MDSLAPIHLTAMTDSANQFEFDVAFSFLQQDEAVATQINDLLQDSFKTFIFSKAQESIAGTDGEEIFNAVFGEKARTVAVLYRPGWGDTPWTRIEGTAIKNRALLRDGYDFATFVMLEGAVSPPKWVPKTRIYYSLPKYGIDGALPNAVPLPSTGPRLGPNQGPATSVVCTLIMPFSRRPSTSHCCPL